MALLANFHTHTTFCDGENTAREMTEAALSLSFRHLGFSSHGDTWFDPEYRLDTAAYLQECRALSKEYSDRIEILAGIEQDCLADLTESLDADYRIGSTHYLLVDGQYYAVDDRLEIVDNLCRLAFGGDYYAYCKAYYRQEAKVYARTKCAFYGHYDLVTRFNDQAPRFDEEDARYLNPALETMEYLAKLGIPFEINTGAMSRGRKKQPYPSFRLLKALHAFGGEIIISSDAHNRKYLNGCFPEAIQLAIAAGFTHTNILTKTGFCQLALDSI